MYLSDGFVELNSITLQHLIGSMILIVPRSFRIAMNLKSLSSSYVLTEIGIIETTAWFKLREEIAVNKNSVKLRRELDVADRQLLLLDTDGDIVKSRLYK